MSFTDATKPDWVQAMPKEIWATRMPDNAHIWHTKPDRMGVRYVHEDREKELLEEITDLRSFLGEIQEDELAIFKEMCERGVKVRELLEAVKLLRGLAKRAEGLPITDIDMAYEIPNFHKHAKYVVEQTKYLVESE